MQLSHLAQGLGVIDRSADPDITVLTADSRAVVPGALFAALPGVKVDGAAFASQAEANGAVAVLCRNGVSIATSLPVVRCDDARHALAVMAARFFGRQPEHIVAVTGTAGKTSIATFTRQIWEKTGQVAASIGTIGVVSRKRIVEGTLTTPDPVALAQLMAQLAEDGVTHAAMEASSHGLDQRRLEGVRIEAAAFTNLGHDHFDYHPDPESYFQAKMRLFTTLLPKGGAAVINADDVWSGRAIDVATKMSARVMTTGRKGTFLTLKRLEHERSRQIAEIAAEGRIYRIALPLAGSFQMSNALVSAGLAIATGVPVVDALAALESLEGAAGRLELTGTTPAGVPVFVDYAHKPEALENVLSSVRPFTTGKILVVVGCGGDRDRAKRPMMGEIASRLADAVFVTDDNPRSEDAASIRAAIMAAAPGAREIADRREAIRQAIRTAISGDTVVIAGKGHETGQKIGDIVHPFSDHEEVRSAIAELQK
ncbi:UDP-N-acetylmuramoyl-L-alanyl-D-glutamate--2,6-diaminopimelate ligase [Jiella sp. MQZ9-1]|uniref:UDP-N-acetylmuramoyl-L-alanyl-D-glutamate--2,6-diaminopimelate ligase n=1 Tax=Jiella flava TaxID=2816857 RepID=A0A939JSB6_9HYPH|nr:UDP-N-acetylmuramoyl-L-alanyl-D-glutamate--2,6-diaminopimelate ligase [Jiella flava]MBO0662793.1 UDP-N-acetylmuramoyl-L-alanyl-D-glutamate--2,6-diaminopimelate ligase [Jiella flava]MCD2471214.1 UDP-N-acetylmuramoyl-L-alanyl-D-glutamate--2,6-diaminopimelate ligase [Jiella flava]